MMGNSMPNRVHNEVCSMMPLPENRRRGREIYAWHTSASQRFLIGLLDHLRARLGIDLRGLELGVPQELLDLLNGHAPLQERGGYGVAEQVRVHPLGDLGIGCGLLDDLLDAPGRVLRVLDRLEQIAGGAMAEVGSEFLSQLRENRHIPTLPALGFR